MKTSTFLIKKLHAIFLGLLTLSIAIPAFADNEDCSGTSTCYYNNASPKICGDQSTCYALNTPLACKGQANCYNVGDQTPECSQSSGHCNQVSEDTLLGTCNYKGSGKISCPPLAHAFLHAASSVKDGDCETEVTCYWHGGSGTCGAGASCWSLNTSLSCNSGANCHNIGTQSCESDSGATCATQTLDDMAQKDHCVFTDEKGSLTCLTGW